MCCKHIVVAPPTGLRATQTVTCFTAVILELVVEPDGVHFQATVCEMEITVVCIEGPGFLMSRVASVQRTAHASAEASFFS